MLKKTLQALLLVACVQIPAAAMAATVTVEMKNVGPGGMMVFSPDYVQANPGDTIVFKATDKGHNAMSIPGMTPDGAVPLVGKMSQDVSVTLKQPGLYGIKCLPHYSMGMVALIKVGKNATNYAAAAAATEAMPPLAKKKMADLLNKAK